ncbi:MAG: alpha/beta fold hydrolase [Bryobacteraceae bacterium]|nr:alpha/beta fold hydrolase [Bryobacteraceae bacterium]
MRTSNSASALKTIAKGAGVVTATGLAAAAGWTAWSALFINHRQSVPPAIRANRYVTATPLSGRLSFYADESASSGRPLILLHSINAAASSYEMLPVFEHFRGKRPVFALDLPGFGFSERAERTYHPDIYVQAILDFVDGELAGADAVDIVALSLSSEFAAIAAVEQPDFFHSLAMIAPTGFQSTTPRGSERVHRAVTFPVWSQAVFDLLVTRPSIDYFLQKAFAGQVDPGLADYAFLTSHRPGARYAPFYFIAGKLFTPDVRSWYSAIQQPVLAFCDLGDFGPSDLLPQFCRDHANWEMACIEDTKSMPHFENPGPTFERLEAFLSATEEPHQVAAPESADTL